MAREVPSIPTGLDAQTRNFFSAIREAVNEFTLNGGSNANTLNSNLTAANLTGISSSLDKLLSTTIPPKPLGVVVTGIFSTIMVTWNNPNYAYYSFAEIWRANALDNLGLLIPATGTNANGHSINFATDAKLVGTSNGHIYTDNVEPASKYYYWIRFLSEANIAGPYNSDTGLIGATVQDINALMLANGWTIAAEKVYQTGQWIGGAAILNGAIDNLKMADFAITEAKMADLAITTAKLNANAVTNAKIIDGAITEVKVGTDAITSTKIAALAVTNAKIDNLAVGNSKIANLAVDNAKIAALAVDAAKIANAAITNAKIDNLAVDGAKIALLAVDSTKITDAAITNAKIANLAVDNAKIANLAVDTAKITNAAITNAKMGLLSVGTAQIQDLAVTSAKINSLAVEKLYAVGAWIASADILDGSITNAKIGNTIQSDNYNGSTLGWQLSKNGGTLNVNQITIRDAAGNIILSSGTGIPWSGVSGADRPADYATVGATFGSNIYGQITPANISTYIANLAVDTLQIAGNAVVIPVTAKTSVSNFRIVIPESASVWVDVCSVSLNMSGSTSNGKVILQSFVDNVAFTPGLNVWGDGPAAVGESRIVDSLGNLITAGSAGIATASSYVTYYLQLNIYGQYGGAGGIAISYTSFGVYHGGGSAWSVGGDITIAASLIAIGAKSSV